MARSRRSLLRFAEEVPAPSTCRQLEFRDKLHKKKETLEWKRLVVVVVQTRCNDEMFVHDAARDAPSYGGRVPVDTAPGPVPMYRA